MNPEQQYSASHTLVVYGAESGMKLLRFLECRLGLPPALLHRWLRTGQVRLNGRRAKPFVRVSDKDAVRLPPFAPALAGGEKKPFARAGEAPLPPPLVNSDITADGMPAEPPFLACTGCYGDIWALYKARGLPTHGGTGHSDSLAARLAARYAEASFTPTPAHRLDKDTSGVLLVAASYAALQTVHAALREGRIIKEYLVWARGCWPFESPRLLRHYLRKEETAGFEKVRVVSPQDRNASLLPSSEARCLVRALNTRPEASLLQVRLLTGRTHQIRAQLAAMGHPVLGDAKYGAAGGTMRLHAMRVVLPEGAAFACLPPWAGKYAAENLPEVIPSENYPE